MTMPLRWWLGVAATVACLGAGAVVVLWPEIRHRLRRKRRGGYLHGR